MGFVAGPKRTWWSTFVVLGLVLLFCFVVTGPAGIHQARAADADEAAAGQQEEEPQETMLEHIVTSAGIFFGPLLLAVSIALVTLIVLLAMDLRMSVAIPPDFVEDFTETINKRQFKQAFELARGDNSYVAKVLTAGMGRLQYGLEDAREASVNMAENVKAGKEGLISYLAVIGTLGPMLGLVGTVYGMIQSFMVIANSKTAPKPSELGKGISHALVVTLLGIALSVPAIFFHSIFKNRLTRIALDSNNIADDLLTQMYHNSKRAGTAAETARPTAAPVATAATAVKPAE